MKKNADVKLNIRWKLMIYSLLPLIATCIELFIGIRLFLEKIFYLQSRCQY